LGNETLICWLKCVIGDVFTWYAWWLYLWWWCFPHHGVQVAFL